MHLSAESIAPGQVFGLDHLYPPRGFIPACTMPSSSPSRPVFQESAQSIFAIYSYPSVPLLPQSIPIMVEYISSRLRLLLERIIVCLDYEQMPPSMLQSLQHIPNCEPEFLTAQHYERSLYQLIWRLIASLPSSGTIVLISGNDAELTTMVKMIRFRGWQCVVVHPPTMSSNLLMDATLTLQLPIRKEESTTVRLYERRAHRSSCYSSEKTEQQKHFAQFLHWSVSSLDQETILEALNMRNDFPKELARALDIINDDPSPSPNSIDLIFGHSRKLSFSAMNLPSHEVSPSLPKAKAEEKKMQEKRMLVRWKRDTVNHDKIAHCTKSIQHCPKWNNRVHVKLSNCKMWHPHQACGYYPRCHWKAESCGFAHPFCTDGPCRCPVGQRDPQKNHYIPES